MTIAHTLTEDVGSDRGASLGGALTVLAGLLWLPQAAAIAYGLAALLEGRSVSALGIGLGFAGLAAGRAGLTLAAQRVLSRAADTRAEGLRRQIIGRETSTLHPSRHGGAGALSALLTEKIEALRPALLRYRPSRMRVIVIPPVILLIALFNSWAVAVILLLAGPLIPIFMALVGWAAKEASARQMAEVGSFNDLLADRLNALSDLRLISAGPRLVAGFATASDALRDQTMAVLRIAFLSSAVLELFSALGVAMVAVWVGFSLLGEVGWGTWGAPLSPFMGIFLLLLVPEYFQPLRDLAAAWHDRSAADAVEAELAAWQAEARAPMIGQGAPAGALAFETLTTAGLRYQRGTAAQSFPDLTLKAGESLALTGPSGAGKTTLLRLLAGLDAPSKGRIRVNGQPLKPETADAWRATLGWMPQTPRLLGRSLGYNIGFGAAVDPACLNTARADAVVAALPHGTGTILGENGAGLSGGEARRILLARALQHRPALILADEPTADLDAGTAQDIIDGLLAHVASGGALIAATHDPRLIAALTREVRLEGGE